MVLGAALLAGVPFGFIAGSGVRIADTTLGRAVEITAAVPAALFAAALLCASQRFYVAACGLGLLKAVEVAWLLRGRLATQRERLRLADQSKVRLPFSVY